MSFWLRTKVAGVYFAIAILGSGVLEGFGIVRVMDLWSPSTLRPYLIWLLLMAAAPYLWREAK